MFADKLPGIPSGVRRALASFDRRCMEWSDAVIMTDERRKSTVGVPAGTLVEVVMNVPPDIPLPRRSRSGDTLRLCYAGSIHEYRGLRVIAEAVKDMEGIETVFAGWIPRVQDERYLRSQSHLTYVGKVSFERSLQLVVDCDVVLALYDPAIPINMLASSNKVYEAMAAARPVITNSETAMADLVREHDCGVLVPYGRVEMLREAVLSLRKQPDLAARLGANGRRVFQERYTWSIMEGRLLSLYASLVGVSTAT
jgi:glycosyltransferase involved in cell wall biosynthesis